MVHTITVRAYVVMVLAHAVAAKPAPTNSAASASTRAGTDASAHFWQAARMSEHTLVLLRHGQSEWNQKNLFTGWVDVGLTELGRIEARRGGELVAERDLLPDVLHTSVMRRAIETAQIALDAADRMWLPVRRSWRLNERHYGALQGKDKKQTLEEFGEEQFMLWRRSYDTPPPPLADDDQWSQAGDAPYAALPPEVLPRTECLKDVVGRMLPYWYDAIVPDLQAGGTVLVVAHGNSLRALVKHLDDISDEDIAGLNIPTGIPLLYRLDTDMRPVTRGGEYLDPDAAAASIEAVKNQGR
jgi:2,3-bisphosphoglycerate-dependent phosphoglycerate mutase